MVSIVSFSKFKREQVEKVNKPIILKLNLFTPCFNVPENELLYFSSLVKTIYGKTCSVDMLVHSSILHYFIDSHFTKPLGLILQMLSIMVITIASHRSSILPRKLVFLLAVIARIYGNSITIDVWYTIYDLYRSYDVIMRKNWISANL
jgi:hypothetical protein